MGGGGGGGGEVENNCRYSLGVEATESKVE